MSINKSIFITLGTSVPSIVMSFIAGIFVTRLMGAEGKGVFSMYQNNAVLFFTFFSLSITNCFNVFLNNKALSPAKIIGISIYIFLISLLLLGAFVFILIFTDNIYLFFPKDYFDSKYLIFFFLYYISHFGITVTSTILISFKEFYYDSMFKLFNIFMMLIFFASLYFFKTTNTLDHKENIMYILYYHLFFQFLLFSTLLFSYFKRIKIKPYFKINYSTDIKPIQNYLLLIHLAGFFSFLNYKFDLWVIQYFGSANSYETSRQIGFYTQASNLTNLLWIVPAQLRVIVLVYVLNETRENKYKIISLYSRINFFAIVAMTLGLMLISYQFITIVYGIEFEATVLPLQILAIGGVFLCHIKFISLIFEMETKPIILIISTIIGIIITFILDFFLIPEYGIIGASIASSASYIGTTLYLIYEINKLSNTPFFDYFVLKSTDIQQVKNLVKSKLKSKKKE